jgi:hypothetical protein
MLGMLTKFPISEIAAKGINETGWSDSIFVPKQDGNTVYVTVPKNIEVFQESLLMMSILKIFEIKNWIPVLSTSDLPKAVLETKEGAFFAGFVSGALQKSTGPLNSGSSKYCKGIRAYQTYSVEKEFGKARHLRHDGMAKLLARLSGMRGFTQEHWGLRASIITLFKGLPSKKVDHLNTYLQPKSELVKNIKTRLQYENGGLYRPEELSYLGAKFADARKALNEFTSQLDKPSEVLARDFEKDYARVKTIVDTADNEIKANASARARILFPQDKKKSTITWAKKPLSEKLSDISEEKATVFKPETLPGIQAVPVTREKGEPWSNYILRKYTGNKEDTKDVILSWYTNFEDEG